MIDSLKELKKEIKELFLLFANPLLNFAKRNLNKFKFIKKVLIMVVVIASILQNNKETYFLLMVLFASLLICE